MACIVPRTGEAMARCGVAQGARSSPLSKTPTVRAERPAQRCGRGHLGNGCSGLTGRSWVRNVLPRAQEIGTADRPVVEEAVLVLTWGGRFSEEDRGADHTAAI